MCAAKVMLFPRQKSASSSPAKAPTPAKAQAVTIDRDSVAQFFHMPLHDAARHFNICVTSLKKVCRRLGYDKWPYVKPTKANPHPVSTTLTSAHNDAALSFSPASTPPSPDLAVHGMQFGAFTPAGQPAPHFGRVTNHSCFSHVGATQRVIVPEHTAGAECVKLEYGGSKFVDFDFDAMLSEGMDSQFILDFVSGTEL